ncbi:MAG: aspartyl/glutamyl-tRNA amidotransferase subunit C [Treponema sp.]|jgi:aspartyl-tRNA(Asn)/glutamyl-tRNA(Gln) amidotransferase subunit C|nr:aspartyl/glutamyl-tRNA amidotransferase subunit C [Treponema sp.]
MNIEDLRETAALAHLNLDEQELSRAFPAFEEMLGFFAAMRAADRELALAGAAGSPDAGLSAVARTVDSLWFRGDGAVSPSPHGAPSGEAAVEQMLDSAGERDGRFVVVPNVL